MSEGLKEVPRYVLDFAPLVHLHSTDPYRPSSLSAHVLHTQPQIAFKSATIPSPPLTLSNLDQLNAVGSNGGSDVYLTSNDDVLTNPKWLEGLELDANGGVQGGEKTCVIVVVDKGNGVTDAFYLYFFSFNWGGVVLANQLGDHIGDWEHNMIRFENGHPKAVWFSQHANGEAYTYSCLKKDGSGKRPLSYCATGSHALYALPGQHDHTIPNLNLPTPLLLVDSCDAGPLYDPLLSAYYYAYTPSTSTLTPLRSPVASPSSSAVANTVEPAPTSFLHFTGRWGDQEYPASDKRQKELAGNKKYVGGPTGPMDKQLDRKEVWPQNSFSKGQFLRTSLTVDGGRVRDWLEKLNCFGKAEKGKEKIIRVNVKGERV